eukprot:COSAG06_NODE_2395_length_6958_cov_4.127132_4_plen_317_part_00
MVHGSMSNNIVVDELGADQVFVGRDRLAADHQLGRQSQVFELVVGANAASDKPGKQVTMTALVSLVSEVNRATGTVWATELQGAGLTVLAKHTQQKATLQHDLFETSGADPVEDIPARDIAAAFPMVVRLADQGLTSMTVPSQPFKHGARCDECSAPFRPLERARANPGTKMDIKDNLGNHKAPDKLAKKELIDTINDTINETFASPLSPDASKMVQQFRSVRAHASPTDPWHRPLHGASADQTKQRLRACFKRGASRGRRAVARGGPGRPRVGPAPRACQQQARSAPSGRAQASATWCLKTCNFAVILNLGTAPK